MSTIENDFAKIWIEDNIVYQEFKKGTILNLASGKIVVSDRKKVSNGVTMPFFVDMTQLVSIDVHTRVFLGTEESCEFLSCGAFLVNNELSKLLINIFIKFNHPVIPTRFFTDKEKALQWLRKTQQVIDITNKSLN